MHIYILGYGVQWSSGYDPRDPSRTNQERRSSSLPRLRARGSAAHEYMNFTEPNIKKKKTKKQKKGTKKKIP
jgi:hypothetical protein